MWNVLSGFSDISFRVDWSLWLSNLFIVSVKLWSNTAWNSFIWNSTCHGELIEDGEITTSEGVLSNFFDVVWSNLNVANVEKLAVIFDISKVTRSITSEGRY